MFCLSICAITYSRQRYAHRLRRFCRCVKSCNFITIIVYLYDWMEG